MSNVIKQAGDIIKGHVNEALGFNEELFTSRMKICNECPLKTIRKTAKYFGPWCNSKMGGCGCRLNAKLRVADGYCPEGKWLGVDPEGNTISYEEALKREGKSLPVNNV